MQQHASAYSTHLRTFDPWGEVKIHFFLKVVMLHIKLIGMEQKSPCKHRFGPKTHLLGCVVKRSNIFFLKVHVMLHVKLKGIERLTPYKHIFYPYTHPRPVRLGQKVKICFLSVVMLHFVYTDIEETSFDLTHASNSWSG